MGKTVSLLILTLIFIGMLSLAFHIQQVKAVATSMVTYDYYVVARAHSDMTPTVPSPAPSPPGFNFTVDPPVFNFGNVTYWGARNYLHDGFAYSPYTNMMRYGPPMAGAIVNITNLLGYDITITNLTAEVTDGTITKDFYFLPAGQPFGNWTMVIVDTLDPGDYDECNYTTGMVTPNRLGTSDRYNKIRPDIPPEQWNDLAPGYSNQGPGSLLEPDAGGDAVATGHVAPIPLVNGDTFTEYFGVIIFGDADVGTQINGTIRLSLTYEYASIPFLEISPNFKDNTGYPFDPLPSSWAILFPNGTTRTIFSSSVTYFQAPTGNYSITSIVWQGSEVVPEIPPNTFVSSPTVWTPPINCRLPTHLAIDLSASTSFIGFKVNINGRLVDYKNTGIAEVMVLMEYSVTGGAPWSVLTSDYTNSDGSYSALWMPSATGNYLVRAAWSGNATHPRTNTTVNLAVIPFEEQNVFAVTSNSTISQLAFNTTDWTLSFAATGPNGTRGYTKVTIAKSLIENIANIRVYLDGNQTEYSVSSLDDSWLLTFTYTHSAHQVKVDLDIYIIPEFSLFLILPLFITTTLLAVVYAKKRKKT